MQTRRTQASAQKLAATELRNFRTFLLMREFAAREIGQRIAQARLEAGGMTQEDLAEALNVSKRSLQAYEAGTTIPWKHFKRLEQIFDRRLDWFIRGEEPARAQQGVDDALVELSEQVQGMKEDQAEMRSLVDQIAESVDRLLEQRAAGE